MLDALWPSGLDVEDQCMKAGLASARCIVGLAFGGDSSSRTSDSGDSSSGSDSNSRNSKQLWATTAKAATAATAATTNSQLLLDF